LEVDGHAEQCSAASSSINYETQLDWVPALRPPFGVALSFIFSAWVKRPDIATSSALLREFPFTAIAARAGQTNWHILEGRTYEPFPALARSRRIARRMVARTELSEAELERFTTQFQQAATAALGNCGAVIKAQFDMVQDLTRVIERSPMHSRVDLTRRYYAIGGIHGVADIWYVAEGGSVTVIVSLIEGP
jgi:hypothetical protein